jgi:proteasome lid subunit RPN8/RPN11
MSELNLVIPPTAATRLCTDIRRYGQSGVETGGFLLTKHGNPTVSVVAVAGTTGIVREYGLFIVTRPAFDTIFTWAEDNELQVRAMVHSHPEEAFMSRTDREGGLRVKDFRSAVVPTFNNPPEDPALWRWWTFTSDWAPTCAPRCDSTVTSTDSVVFDGDGVRAD